MFEPFFGIPQETVRLGKLKHLSGVGAKLYMALCYESERRRTRELTLTVAQLRKLVGGAPNSHVKARNELRDEGLIELEERGSSGFLFRICNPETGRPWPGNPKERVRYQRRGATGSDTPQARNPPAGSQDSPEANEADVCREGRGEAFRSADQVIPQSVATELAGRGTDFDFGANRSQPATEVSEWDEPVGPVRWNDIGSWDNG